MAGFRAVRPGRLAVIPDRWTLAGQEGRLANCGGTRVGVSRSRPCRLTPSGQQAVARFTDIVIHDGSSFAEGLLWASLCAAVLKRCLAQALPLSSGTPDAPTSVATGTLAVSERG